MPFEMPRPALPPSVWRTLATQDLILGVPHYPEHVGEDRWDHDAERMAAAGINTVRMGEFAWHLWEPREGQFDFTLFDHAIDGLARHGIRTILCTPTATPPRWLTATYPDVLRIDANGRPAGHGSRQHADTTSPVFRSHSRRITRALAEQYRSNPHVIGWQTDNELNTTTSLSFSASCRAEFQGWLQRRYATVAALNAAWGGNFWALAYDSFDQIELPRQMAPSLLSPGHVQDYHRFLADATAAFQRDQVEILREANPSWFIFHNLGNPADVDLRGSFGRDLDFLGFDIYPMLYDEFRRWGGQGATQAMYLDMCRSFTGNFIVPEQAAGMGSQPGFATMTPEPGEMRQMAWSSVARGADGLMFFRWRPAHFGAEIYWMGLIDHDDRPRRRYAEARQFFLEMAGLKADLLGSHVHMDVGIAGADFDNQEAHKTYPLGLPSPMEDAGHLHRHCYHRGIACGFIHPEDDLTRLKVLYVPHWVMWKPEWTARVAAFVEAGGTLILSVLTGTRNADNHVHCETAPAAGLSHLAGVEVAEFGRIAEPGAEGLFPPMPEGYPGEYRAARPLPASSAQREHRMLIGNVDCRAAHLYEKLDLAPGTESLGTWSNRHLAGSPCLTSRRLGQGRVVYLASYLTHELAERLGELVLAPAGVRPLIEDLPEGVEVSLRRKQGMDLVFLLNTTDAPRTIQQPPLGHDLLTGRDVAAPLTLGPYGCAVVRRLNS
jgi:beta-galactosidase